MTPVERLTKEKDHLVDECEAMIQWALEQDDLKLRDLAHSIGNAALRVSLAVDAMRGA